MIFILICYIVLFTLFGYTAFSNYSTNVKLPFYIVGILLFTYVTYVVSSYWSKPKSESKTDKSSNNSQSQNDKQLFEIFKRFSMIYGEYILIIIGIFILCIIFYKLFMGALVYTLSQSIWVSFGLIILILALVKNTMYKKDSEEDSDWMTLIKDIIFYIPCLITDGIEFIKKDYENTPSTTFVVFLIIVVFASIFFLAPLLNTDGGNLLISGPKTLNSVTRFSTDEILSFEIDHVTEWDMDISYNDISYNRKKNIIEYPKDPVTQTYLDEQKLETATNKWGYEFKKKKEGFSSLGLSLVQQDTHYDFSSKPKPSEEKTEYNNFDIVQVYEQASHTTNNEVNKIYSKFKSVVDVFNYWSDTDPYSPYIYNFAMSFWLYINTFHFKKISNPIQEIVSFGKRISIQYDNVNNELIILLNDKEVYRSKGILYQRWNHVVVNSNDSKIDLFVNNNLVGTYKYRGKTSDVNLVPPISIYDTLTIGSTKNINFGNICNFRYYNNSIDLSKIKSIYTKYNKKTPPL